MTRARFSSVATVLPVVAVLAVLAASSALAQVRERCAWTGVSGSPGVADVSQSPPVVDLDGDGVAEIVFVAYDGDRATSGRLVVISGSDCSERFVVGSVGCRACVDEVACRDLDLNGDGAILYPTGLAAGDLDGDGSPEIVGILEGDVSELFPQRLIAFGSDGSFRWCSEIVPLAPSWVQAPLREGIPSIADLDGDGRAEILVGTRAFDADGRLVRESAWLDDAAATSVAVDVDRDGVAEMSFGGALLDGMGAARWHRGDLMSGDPLGTQTSGSAPADVDGDGMPEIVLAESTSRTLHVLDGLTGATRASAVLPPAPAFGCSESLGVPALGDVDGDGVPEIAVASGTELSLLGWSAGPPEALVLRWVHAIDDCSSGSLSAAFADVTGDGLPEVLLRDEQSFWILRGDGSVLQRFDTSSVTYRESVVAADVDGDCSGELVISEDAWRSGTHRGVRVFEGELAPLPPMRPVWNQTTYHGTNVGDDGSIPRFEEIPRSVRAQDPARPAPADVRASVGSLWPPNHRMVRVRFDDASGRPVWVESVFQDEPVEDRGDGSFEPDAIIEGDTVLLRAERSGRGDGRTYHVAVIVGSGACEAREEVSVCVPHDRRPSRRGAGGCGDQGPLFDSCAPES